MGPWAEDTQPWEQASEVTGQLHFLSAALMEPAS